jgi:hypothetical protein
MSVIRTFTVTVSDPGSGNKYFIDGVQQDTINLAETGTYVFNYPSAHPFRFSTTSDGTHNSGSEYTTGVTVNSSTQVQITVAASAPTLYYYCSIHPGMGGQANTVEPDSYGMFAWNVNEWGSQDGINVSLTAPSGLTSSTGSIAAFSEQGWGSDSWGYENWGESGFRVLVSGVSATASVGEIVASAAQGWGRAEWGEAPWGESDNPVVTLDGLSMTSSVGSVTIQDEINTGWGHDGWGVENWGASGLTVELTAPSELTSSLPDTTWGAQGWGGSSDSGDVGVTWGGDFILNVADVMGVTGVSATSAIGSPTIILSPTISLTAPSGLTSNVGALSVGDITIGLSGFGLTSAIGAITPADVVGISSAGVATTGVGSITVDESLIVSITGVGATSSVGSVITEVAYTLTAPATLTSGVGAITPADVIGLTGVEATTAVGNVAPLGYFDVDITGNTNYNDIDITGNTSYTDVA